jgi:hypothetical protein
LKNRTGNQRGVSKLSTSLVIGLLLVPLSAVAAVALINPSEPAQAEEVVAVEATFEPTTSTTSTVVSDVVAPEIASSEDLALACGAEGLALVAKEADETITPLEQAALDSLRAICVSEGMELPGPPAPKPVVETVTVAAGPSTGGSDADNDTTTTTVNDAAAEFEAAYAATVAYINKAIDDGARGEKITLAEQLVAEAGVLADGGNYTAGLEKLAEARQAADQADRTSHDDDDEHEEHEDDHDGGHDDD